MKRKRYTWLYIVLGFIVAIFIFSFIAVSFIPKRGGGSFKLKLGDKVAVIPIKGLISSSKPVADQIRRFAKDNSVKAIVLRINSPGGGVAASQEIYEEIKKAKRKKIIITSMGSVAASGGYYIASASNKILANPGTITGSIGVIMEFTNFEELMKKIGIKGVVIKSGKFKDIGSPTRPLTDEERALLSEMADNIKEQFVKAVAEGRNMDIEEVRKIADGRIFTGEQALKLSLIDKFGNLYDAIELAAKMAGIKGEPHVVYSPRRISWWRTIANESIKGFIDLLMEIGPARYLLYHIPTT